MEFLLQLATTAPLSADNPIRPRLLAAFHASVAAVLAASAIGIGYPLERIKTLLAVMEKALAIAERRTAEASYPAHTVASSDGPMTRPLDL